MYVVASMRRAQRSVAGQVCAPGKVLKAVGVARTWSTRYWRWWGKGSVSAMR